MKNNNKFLIKFICYCIIFEHNLIYNKNFDNLIEFALIKKTLKNHNIFTIFRYMDFLYENIINKDICLNCLCNNKEKFEIGSNCHHSNNLNNNIYNKFQKIKIFPKCKNKTHSTSLNYSFDEINNSLNNYKDDDIEIISNYLLYDKIFKRNIYYTINKVNKLNNSMDDSESSEIDIFQKMNEGSQSLIKKEMINKIFDECNKYRQNRINIFNEENSENEKKVRHISKLSSSSDIINAPNCQEEDNMLNKIKNYFEESNN